MTYSFSCPLVITDIFPSPYRPEAGAFIQSLSNAMEAEGANVTVLAPQSLSQMLIARLRNSYPRPLTYENKVLRPGYWTFSSRLLPWQRLGWRLTVRSYKNIIRRSFTEAAQDSNWVYTHFFKSGWASIDLCERHKLKCILALGESQPTMNDIVYGPTIVTRTLQRFAGIIAVSKDNEEYCRERWPSIGERLVYLPNAIDTTLFTTRNKEDVRRELRLPIETRIAIFCGHWIERKGPLRVLEALEFLDDVKGVFLGQGSQVPTGDKVLFAGSVEHEQVAKWLAAADVFVLPSFAEGMSNAILEALASGLPVVVSDRSFNRAFLDSSAAIFVDPGDPQEIAAGIQVILDNPERQQYMSESARKLGVEHSLAERARRLLDFAHNLI